jgi:hypothetical protein
MSDMIFIRADGLDAIASQFAATEKQVEAAMRRAVTRTTRWAGTQVARKVSSATKIRAGVLKGRMVVDFVGRDGTLGRVWAGLKPIDLKRLKPRQTNSGVTAGPAKRPGAFISQKLGGHVFERVGKSRLPIKKSEGVPIYDPGVDAVAAVAEQVGERLMREFEHEMSWQTSRK